MMQASSKRQQQTHILSKLRRPAPGTARHSVRLSRAPKKRLTMITLGMVAGLGLPALAFASQQHLTNDASFETSRSEPSSTQTETSSPAEEVFSSSVIDMKVETAPGSSGEMVGQATINGETIPLTNDSTTTRHIDSDSNSVNVDISVDNGDASTSISSSSSTEVHIESYSSSDGETNNTRGSPRR